MREYTWIKNLKDGIQTDFWPILFVEQGRKPVWARGYAGFHLCKSRLDFRSYKGVEQFLIHFLGNSSLHSFKDFIKLSESWGGE